MNRETGNFYDEQEINEALQRYEEMLRKGVKSYFDVFQIEQIAERFVEEGKVDPALQIIEMGMEQHPTSIALKIRMVNILFNLGEIAQSLKLADELLQIEKTNHELYLMKGSALLLMGDQAKANNAFNLSLKYAHEDRDETLFNIGYSFEQNGNYESAIKYLEEAIFLNPDNEAAYYELAYCYEKIEQNEKSLIYYNKYIDLDTFSDSAWFNVGIVLTKMQRFEESVEAYEYALVINEDFPNAWYNLGHSNMLLRNYTKAIECFNKYLEYDEVNDELFCLIGDCYLRQKELDKAFDYYQQTISQNKKNERAWFGLGLVMILKREYIEAFKYLQKTINFDEGDSECWFMLAKVASKIKYHNDAIEAYDYACDLAPEIPAYWLSYANMLAKRGLLLKAVSVMKRGLKHHNNHPLFDYRIAACLLEAGQDENARKHLVRALKNDFINHKYVFVCYPYAIENEMVKNLIVKYNPNKNPLQE